MRPTKVTETAMCRGAPEGGSFALATRIRVAVNLLRLIGSWGQSLGSAAPASLGSNAWSRPRAAPP